MTVLRWPHLSADETPSPVEAKTEDSKKKKSRRPTIKRSPRVAAAKAPAKKASRKRSE